jgi:hypothetical protein
MTNTTQKLRLPALSRSFLRGFLAGVLVMLLADLAIALILAKAAGAF